MPDYWLDADSFITPSRGPYRFSVLPPFWDYLEQKAQEQIIGSPEIVLTLELIGSDPKKADELEIWAKQQQGILFIPPNKSVQTVYSEVVESVTHNSRYVIYEVQLFLSGADPWVIAYAKALGGKVVTFETTKPLQKKPKIPDVAATFGVRCISLWDMLTELGASF